jgi:signal transduction histidine kinase
MALLFTKLLGISAIFLGYLLYDFGKQNFIRETEAAIDIEIEHILAISKSNQVDSVVSYILRRGESKKHPIYFYQNKDGDLLAGNIEKIPDEVKLIKEGVISFYTFLNFEKRLVAGKIHTFDNSSRLLVARDITSIMHSYDRLKYFSFVIIAFIFLVVFISFFISMFVVTRINKIANTAKDIMNTGDLSRRIDIDSNWDDLSYLAKILNDFLTEIELLMQGIRDVSDNIAHDLRTPISRLRGELESLKNKKLSAQDIDILVSETDSILNIFNSLLRIANIEKNTQKQYFKKLDISHILNDVIDLYEPLADEKTITIQKDIQPFIILADCDLLFQMFANILDNAIKFSSQGGYIAIKSQNNKVVISDSGIGIPQAELIHVFDRFYRSDKSRNTKGTGLGLSMVKAIANLHEIKIKLKKNNPGLKVELSF